MTEQRLTAAIAIVGTLLTAGGLVSSYFQYKAADLQAQAAIAALLPQVQVRTFLERVDSDKFTDQRLEITSDGGPIYNFHADRITWFQVRQGRQVIHEQWLTGYFFADHPTGRIKGALQLTTGYKNNEKYIAFDRLVRTALGSPVEITRPFTLLSITYTDALKKEGQDFFLIEGGTTQRLQSQEGARLWQEKKAAFEKTTRFDLDSVEQPEKLAELLAILKKSIK